MTFSLWAWAVLGGCSDISVFPDVAPDFDVDPTLDPRPCTDAVMTAMAAENVPVDLAAMGARSGARLAEGRWADGDTTDVSVSVDVDPEFGYVVTSENTACTDGNEGWWVLTSVTVVSADGVLDAEWEEYIPADPEGLWAFTYAFDEAAAGVLRGAAGYDAVETPDATLTLTWADTAQGEVLTSLGDPEVGATIDVLTFSE